MKKKIIIPIIALFITVVAVIIYNNKTTSIITLDINPSLKIELNKNEKIKNIIAINNDAKEIIDNNFKNESLNKTLETIINKIIEKGYINDNHAEILLYSKGNINPNSIKNKLIETFDKQKIAVNIIIIKDITKEDETHAKKYNITPAKANYINNLTKENNNLSKEDLSTKSISELRETKETGNYCDKGYKLEGTNCLKEIKTEPAQEGEKCPDGYTEYNSICYEETDGELTNNLICQERYTLKDNKCLKEEIEDAIPEEYNCPSGKLGRKSDFGITAPEAGNDSYICADTTTAQKPVLRCLTSNYHIIIDGKCYNGPAPVINGGCPNGDTLLNDGCYSKDDEDQWICPNGNIYHKSQNSVPEYCPDTIKYTEANITKYKCEGNKILQDDKCLIKDEQKPEHEKICPNGYTLVNTGNCINYNNTTNKINGLICTNDTARLKNDKCIIYELKEAKHR